MNVDRALERALLSVRAYGEADSEHVESEQLIEAKNRMKTIAQEVSEEGVN